LIERIPRSSLLKRNKLMNIFLPLLIAISLSVPAKPVVFNNGTFTVNLTYPNSSWVEVYKLPAGTMEDEVCDLVDYWHARWSLSPHRVSR
jgi:hypothetical protein